MYRGPQRGDKWVADDAEWQRGGGSATLPACSNFPPPAPVGGPPLGGGGGGGGGGMVLGAIIKWRPPRRGGRGCTTKQREPVNLPLVLFTAQAASGVEGGGRGQDVQCLGLLSLHNTNGPR